MMENHTLIWNKESLRALRLRMGWSKSDLARRLHCSSDDIDSWEGGNRHIELSVKAELELLLRQAEACCDEVQFTPAAENQCTKNALEQIDFTQVKANLD